MKIVVTGGAGFIGSHVVERLAASGHEVVVIDDLSAGSRENVPAPVALHVADIRSPEAADVIAEAKPEAVIHLAAQIDLRRSYADPAADADVNLLGSVRMLQAAATAGCRRFVFASSAAVYGLTGIVPTPETTAIMTTSPYGAAKASVENYLNVFRSAYGMKCAVLRFANVYGPRQGLNGEGGVVSVFVRELLAGRPGRIFGDGSQTRDFVYAGDVARAVVMATENGYDGTCNVGTAQETSVRELHARLSGIVGSVLKPEAMPAVAGDAPRSALSATHAAATLGFRAETDLTDGLRQTVDWFKKTVK